MRDTKSIGCAMELEFAAQCIRRGAIVSQPLGDNAPYDFLVHYGDKFHKVQVKASSNNCFATSRRVPQVSGPSSKIVHYKEGEIDIIVSKIGDTWFLYSEPHLLPSSIRVNPEGPDKQKYMHGKEAWHLIFKKTETTTTM